MKRYLMLLLVAAAAAFVALSAYAAKPPTPPPPQLSFDPSTHSFGTVAAGARSTAKTFTLIYAGKGSSGGLSVQLQTGQASEFTITADTCSGTGLNSRRTCTVTVEYAPQHAGASDATNLVATGRVLTATASLSGTASAGTNQAPTATAQSVTTPEDTGTALALGGSDPDGDTLTYKVTALPSHGSLYAGSNTTGHLIVSGDLPYSLSGNNVYYMPASNYNGSDSLQFKANDGTLDSASAATVSLTVTAVNDAPSATAQSVSTAEDTGKAITLAGTDPDGNTLTYKIESLPSSGGLFVGSDTSGHQIASGDLPYSLTGSDIYYLPDSDYNGADGFTFKAYDGADVSASAATVSITVTAVNDAPTATAQSVSTNEDTGKAITLAGTDPEGDPLSYKVASLPGHGSLYAGSDTSGHEIVSGDLPYGLSGSAVYFLPDTNYNGSDSFTFKANDGTIDSASAATVSITVTAVNDAPTATAQSVSVVKDTGTALALGGSDPDGDTLTYKVTALPSHGSLYAGSNTTGHLIVSGDLPYSLGGSGVYYLPTTGYTGSDSFQFKANDGTVDSASAATISLTVSAITATCSLSEGFNDVTTLTGSGWYMQNTSDDNTNASGWFQGKSATASYSDWSGSNVFNAQAGAANSYIAADYWNTYQTADPGYPVTISNWLVTPPLTLENGATFSFYTQAYDNYYVDRLQVWLSPTNSTNVGTTSGATDTGDFTTKLLDINPDYTSTGFPYLYWGYQTVTISGLSTSPTTGRIAFRYYVEDGGNYGANADYIGIDTVHYSCHPPTASAQSVSTSEDTGKAITLSGSDPDGDTLGYKITSVPYDGQLYAGSDTNGHEILYTELPYSLSGSSVYYVPTPGYNGSDSFTFKANDGSADSNAATVSITVGTVNNPPTAVSVTGSSWEQVGDWTGTITLTGYDLDGDELSFYIRTNPTHGTLGAIETPTCLATPSWHCTAEVSFTGDGSGYFDSFQFDYLTFYVNDGHVDSDDATVQLGPS